MNKSVLRGITIGPAAIMCASLVVTQCFAEPTVFTDVSEWRDFILTNHTYAIYTELPSINFNEIPANQTNTYINAASFSGIEYRRTHGVTFASPSGSMVIAPVLSWNSSKSLSIGRFPFDAADGGDADSLAVGLKYKATAVGLSLVDNGGGENDYVTFECAGGSDTIVSLENHEFIGIVDAQCPIDAFSIVEGEDGDDLTYDDFLIVLHCNNSFSPAANTIQGGSADEVLCGGSGNDTIRGGGGNDLILGSVGRDTLYGQSGNDMIYGGRDGDSIYGGYGADILDGAGGPDRIQGGPGGDIIRGRDGNDTLVGGLGKDNISGGEGDDSILARDDLVDHIGGGKGRDSAQVDTIDSVDGVESVSRR